MPELAHVQIIALTYPMLPSSSSEVAVVLPLLVSLAPTLTTIVIHGFALLAVLRFVHREYLLRRAGILFWRDMVIIAMVILLAQAAHAVEIAIWAIVLGQCGEFTRFTEAFYHSAVNYTSLGYGDIVMSASWKLLGPVEAANGLLMFGVSTAMIFAVIQRLVQSRLGPPDP